MKVEPFLGLLLPLTDRVNQWESYLIIERMFFRSIDIIIGKLSKST
jgi:hypothetical protein